MTGVAATQTRESVPMRAKLQRMISGFIERTIAEGSGTGRSTISPASQSELVLNFLARCRQLGNDSDMVRLLMVFGWALRRSANLATLDSFLAEALALPGLTADDRVGLAARRVHLLIQAGQRETAWAVLERARRAATTPLQRAIVDFNEGNYHRAHGDYAAGERCLRAALAVAAEIGHARLQTSTLNELGNLMYVQQRYEEALPLCEQALAVARRAGLPTDQGHAAVGVAMTLDELGRHTEAMPLHAEGRDCFERAGDQEGITRSHLTRSRHAFLQGKLDEAVREAHSALVLARRLGDLTREAWAQEYLARVAIERGAWADAWGHLSAALDTLLLLGKRFDIQKSISCIEEMCARLHADTEAEQPLRERLLHEAKTALAAAREVLPPAAGTG